MLLQNILKACILLIPFGAIHSQALQFKECESVTDSSCHQEARQAFTSEIINQVIESKGHYFNDSIHFNFDIDTNGNIHINESFALYSSFAKGFCATELKNSNSKFSKQSYGGNYDISFVFNLPLQFEDYKGLEEIEKPLPVKAASDFNLKAKRGCARYLMQIMEARVNQMEDLEDELHGRFYFEGGQIAAIEFTSFGQQKNLNDMLPSIFSTSSEDFIDSATAKESPNQWIPFEIYVGRDSAKAFAYGQQQLDYLATLKDKQHFLDRLIKYTDEYYEDGAVKAKYISDRLEQIGFKNRTAFKSRGVVYSIDSIKNYKAQTKHPDDEEATIKNFGMVEQVPTFKGCEKFDNNEELKRCFQEKMLQHVSQTFNFPKQARKNGIQGRVYTNFVIEKSGEVSSIEVLRSAHPLLDFEAIRTISLIPDMKPANQDGVPVRMSFTIPINAMLQ